MVPQPSIASIIGVLLPAVYNPNLCSDESGHLISEAEVRASSMAAALVGYDPAKSEGVFTFGGTGGLLYGMKVGLEKALPGSARSGVRGEAAVLVSDCSHYACRTVAAWLGIGQDHVVAVPTHADNSMNVPAFEAAARDVLKSGRRIAAIVATMGTTDAFGLDDLAAIHAVRKRLIEEFMLPYQPHLHADAVIGWAWSVFNDYDFLANPLGFRGRTVRALAAAQHRIRHLPLADSVGIDFHKTGFAPYISSLTLFRRREDLQSIARQRSAMPYLFQSGEHHPGMFTLETSRSGTGPMAALASLMLLGKQGLSVLLGHAVEMAEVLREQIESHPNLTVLNGENHRTGDAVSGLSRRRRYVYGERSRTARCGIPRATAGPQCLQPPHLSSSFTNEALQGHGVAISLTECYRQTDYGEPIVALKSYVISPFSDESRMNSIIDHVLDARAKIEAGAKT